MGILDQLEEEVWPEFLREVKEEPRMSRRRRREEPKLPPITISIEPCKNGYVVDFSIQGEDEPVNERLIARNQWDALKYVKRFVTRIG
jgi:hypothetical protein